MTRARFQARFLSGVLGILFLAFSPLLAESLLRVPVLSADQEADFVIPVVLDLDRPISALQFNLLFDARIGEAAFSQDIRGDLLEKDHDLTVEAIEEGVRVVIASVSLHPLRGRSGTVVQLRRRLSDTSSRGSTIPLQLAEVVAVDPLGNRLEVATLSGEVQVGADLHPPIAGANSLFFPQVADGSYGGGHFRTLLNFVDLSGLRTQGEASFFHSTGAPLTVELEDGRRDSRFSFTVEPFGSVFLRTNAADPLVVGYAKVTATSPLGGTLLFTARNRTGRILLETGVASSRPMTEFSVPVVYERGEANTGLALVNSANSTARLVLSLRNPGNREVDSRVMFLDPGQHLPQYATEFFPSLRNRQGFQGFIDVSATQPVSAVALQQRGTLLTTFPVVEP